METIPKIIINLKTDQDIMPQIITTLVHCAFAPDEFYLSIGVTSSQIIDLLLCFYKLFSCDYIYIERLEDIWTPLTSLFGSPENLKYVCDHHLKSYHIKAIEEISGIRKDQIFVLENVPCWNEPKKYEENLAKYPKMCTDCSTPKIGKKSIVFLMERCHLFLKRNIQHSASFCSKMSRVLQQMDADSTTLPLLKENWVGVSYGNDISQVRSPGTLFLFLEALLLLKRQHKGKKHIKQLQNDLCRVMVQGKSERVHELRKAFAPFFEKA